MQLLKKIGKTPLVKLEAFGDLAVYAKLEYKNPSGSVKDRIAYRMVRDAEDSGVLGKGMGIIEVSSGNTGIGLAMVGKELGHPVTIVTGFGVTDDAKRIIKAYGAEVVEVEGWNKKCYERVNEIMEGKLGHFFWPNQATSLSALKSNEELGEEIARQLDVDVFLASMGTGSTITGVARALKKRNPKTKIYLVLPAAEYSVHGVGDYADTTVPLPLFDKTIVDHEIRIAEEDAVKAARRLHSNYGHYVGISSGAVFAAAEKISSREKGNAVIIFPDSGNRYTDILSED